MPPEQNKRRKMLVRKKKFKIQVDFLTPSPTASLTAFHPLPLQSIDLQFQNGDGDEDALIDYDDLSEDDALLTTVDDWCNNGGDKEHGTVETRRGRPRQ